MNFGPDYLLSRLEQLETPNNRPERYIVAYSGGLDSTVMLCVLARHREQHGKELLAVHVDHRLQADSDAWAQHCRQVADQFDVGIHCVAVDIEPNSGRGPEASAREARYDVLKDQVTSKDWLLSAHHRDDQAETLLINLLRGSGPAGVAGIPELRKFAGGWLARPLLDVPRGELLSYATACGLTWIEDPSNDETRYDRNFLRASVLPLLDKRWPNVSLRLAKSASLAREATSLLDELADIDLGSCGERVDRLDVMALRQLSSARLRNALRRAISRTGLAPAPARQLQSIIDDVLPARGDARPVVHWDGADVRRFRGRLYLLAAEPRPAFDGLTLRSGRVRLGAGLGSLELEKGTGPGLSADCIRAGLSLRLRTGGEQIKPLGQTHTRKLKKLLQEEGVVPWMRDRVPLVYSGDRLVAVGDLWLDADTAVKNGAVLRWHDRPALF